MGGDLEGQAVDVLATLSGEPSGATNQDNNSVIVVGVDAYFYKFGSASLDCADSGVYGAQTSAGTSITIDQSAGSLQPQETTTLS